MVICVPFGNGNKTSTGFWEDSTRLPEYYNGTYELTVAQNSEFAEVQYENNIH